MKSTALQNTEIHASRGFEVQDPHGSNYQMLPNVFWSTNTLFKRRAANKPSWAGCAQARLKLETWSSSSIHLEFDSFSFISNPSSARLCKQIKHKFELILLNINKQLLKLFKIIH